MTLPVTIPIASVLDLGDVPRAWRNADGTTVRSGLLVELEGLTASPLGASPGEVYRLKLIADAPAGVADLQEQVADLTARVLALEALDLAAVKAAVDGATADNVPGALVRRDGDGTVSFNIVTAFALKEPAENTGITIQGYDGFQFFTATKTSTDPLFGFFGLAIAQPSLDAASPTLALDIYDVLIGTGIAKPA